MTLLEGINIALRAIGEQEVVSLSTSNPSVGVIKSSIGQNRKSLLATGYWFNTVVETITPDPIGKTITPPYNTLAVYGESGKKYSRDPHTGQLYDIVNRTFEFNGPTYIKCFIDIEFDDLPEYAALYIANKVAAETYRNDIGVDNNFNALIAEAAQSYGLLQREHIRNEALNIKQTSRWKKLNSARFL